MAPARMETNTTQNNETSLYDVSQTVTSLIRVSRFVTTNPSTATARTRVSTIIRSRIAPSLGLEVPLGDRLPLALGSQDEIDEVPHRSVAAPRRRDPVRHAAGLLLRIGRGHGQSDLPEHRNVHQVVSDVA